MIQASKSVLISAVGGAVFVVMMLAGCQPSSAPGSSGSNGGTVGDGQNPVQQKKEIVAGSEPDFRPFLFVDNGQNQGFSHDLLSYVAKDLGVSYKEILMPWDGILPALDTKKIDMVHDAVMITDKRLEKYLFTSPIADGSVGILVRKDDSSIQGPQDLVGKVIGAQRGSAMLDTVQQYNQTTLKGGAKRIVEYVGYPEAYQDLKTKRIDAVANSLPNLQTIVKQFPDQYRIIGTIGPKMYFGWAFRKEDKSFRDEVEQAILKAEKDGTMSALQKKWFGESYTLPDKTPN